MLKLSWELIHPIPSIKKSHSTSYKTTNDKFHIMFFEEEYAQQDDDDDGDDDQWRREIYVKDAMK